MAINFPSSPTDKQEYIYGGNTWIYSATTTAWGIKNVISGARIPLAIPIACSNEIGVLSAGNGKFVFRMPYSMVLTQVRASVTTAQATGSILTVDVNKNGTSILSTKLTIDNTEKSTTTAATPAVLSDTSLTEDSEISIDIDQVGAATVASGLKVYLIGAEPNAVAAACIPIVCSDEDTPLTTGTAKITFRMPYGLTLLAIRASLNVAQATGSNVVVDVNQNGTSIMAINKLVFDNTEKTTVTANTPPVITTSTLANDAEITVDIDSVQSGSAAAGLKVYLLGVPF